MSNGTTGCSPNNYMPAPNCTKTAPNYSQYGRDAVTIQCFQWLDESALPNLSGSFTGYAELDKKGVFCGFKVLSGDMPTSNASVSLCKEEPAPIDETGQSCDTPMNVQLCPETINAIKGSTIVDNANGTVSAVNADGVVLVTWNKSGHTVVDNADGTVSALDAAGSVITTWDKTDTNTTYTYSLVGDVFTATGSDGSVQTVTITHPPQTVDTDTVLGDPVVNSASGLVTWPVLDLAGNPTGDTRTGDFSGFISSPHPTIVATGDATAAFDAATNEWSIGFVDTDTDTDTTYTLTQNANGDTVLTASDGSTPEVIPNTDTDVSAVKLEWDASASSFVSTVTEDGVDVVGTLAVSTDTRKCGDLTLVIDPDTGSLTKKLLLPPVKHKLTSVKKSFPLTTGAAVDLLVGTDFFQIDNTNPAFTVAENSECFPTNHMQTDVRMGAWKVRIGAVDDSWHWSVLSSADVNNILLQPVLVFNAYGSVSTPRVSASNAVTGSDHVNLTAAQSALDRTTNYRVSWDVNAESTYTPHGQNAVLANASAIIKYRSQIEA